MRVLRAQKPLYRCGRSERESPSGTKSVLLLRKQCRWESFAHESRSIVAEGVQMRVLRVRYPFYWCGRSERGSRSRTKSGRCSGSSESRRASRTKFVPSQKGEMNTIFNILSLNNLRNADVRFFLRNNIGKSFWRGCLSASSLITCYLEQLAGASGVQGRGEASKSRLLTTTPGSS